MPNGAKRTRRAAEIRGRRAETLAAIWLRIKGYRIVETRARTPVGEVDLIAARGRTLAFIEVKQRANLDAALGAVTHANWQRISNAASVWTARRTAYDHFDWRFDLVAITPWQRPRHYKDFWRP